MTTFAQIPKNSREQYRVTSEEFMGKPLVHLRIWYDAGGEFKPTPKGIAIHPDVLPEIIAALQAASPKGGA